MRQLTVHQLNLKISLNEQRQEIARENLIYQAHQIDTSLKAFIHAVFECFNSYILSKNLKRRVLHHWHQWLSHYKSHWRRQSTQQSEK